MRSRRGFEGCQGSAECSRWKLLAVTLCSVLVAGSCMKSASEGDGPSPGEGDKRHAVVALHQWLDLYRAVTGPVDQASLAKGQMTASRGGPGMHVLTWSDDLGGGTAEMRKSRTGWVVREIRLGWTPRWVEGKPLRSPQEALAHARAAFGTELRKFGGQLIEVRDSRRAGDPGLRGFLLVWQASSPEGWPVYQMTGSLSFRSETGRLWTWSKLEPPMLKKAASRFPEEKLLQSLEKSSPSFKPIVERGYVYMLGTKAGEYELRWAAKTSSRLALYDPANGKQVFIGPLVALVSPFRAPAKPPIKLVDDLFLER